MSSKLDNLIRLTAQTFLQRRESLNSAGLAGLYSPAAGESQSTFQKSFSELLAAVNNIKGDDVGLSKLLQYLNQLKRHKVTALYTGIYEGPLFCVCIFILYPKSKIPLHSHPGMYGILKVLHGDVVVKSYTSINEVDYRKPTLPTFNAVERVECLSEKSSPAIITPENNLHEIVNQENQSAVFLDILSPRYESENCYFGATEYKPGVFEINQIPCPTTFHTITIPFPFKVKPPDRSSLS
ncbi:unnamed protein product [Allacma fusca]|uniref:Cysteine dioxygenase n=1 Tax=Allacma fusca TaxID=39272 RepID=A0A8J2LAK4_9HEXA|nr:unnamed protein product [Allacma fusca]